MPLSPVEKVQLALRLSKARCLDLDCCYSEDESHRIAVFAAQGVLDGRIKLASVLVTSVKEISGYLRETADQLNILSSRSIDAPNVRAAERLLRDLADDVRPDADGEGPAKPGVYCSCGVLELAAAVEDRMERLLQEWDALNLDPGFRVHYKTVITAEHQYFDGFRVGGRTTIKKPPRKVTIFLRPEDLTSRDLLHLAYTLHHEFVCHALQGAMNHVRALEDPAPSCHWSEGWMDAFVHDIVWEWVDSGEAPSAWLPMSGQVARGELSKFHDHRYDKPQGLKEDQIRHRRGLRDAYYELAKVFRDYGFVDDEENATAMARRFTLVANTHPEADCDKLKALGTNIRTALRSGARWGTGRDVGVANACQLFLRDRNLAKLERAVSDALPESAYEA